MSGAGAGRRSVPKNIAEMATRSMYPPPMTAVARTDRVSIYTQNVSANHRKLFVTLATSVFATSRWKVRIRL